MESPSLSSADSARSADVAAPADLSLVEQWFRERHLPWAAHHDRVLRRLGVTSVEDLKLVEASEIDELFCHNTRIEKRRATLSFRALGGATNYDHTKVPLDPSILLKHTPPPTKRAKTASPKSNNSLNKNSEPSVLAFGFSVSVTKTREEKIKERGERNEIRDDIIIEGDEKQSTASDPPASASIASTTSCIPNTTTTPLQIETSNFRALRCAKSQSLQSPASSDERICWQDNLLPKELQCCDLEDVDGFYSLLGGNKTTSDADLANLFRVSHRDFKLLARTHHPDKIPPDDPKRDEKITIYNKANHDDQQRKMAFDHLCIPDNDCAWENTFSMRVMYDRKGEERRSKFLSAFNIAHPGKSFSVRAAEINNERNRKSIYSKVAETKKANKVLSPLEIVVKKWVITGQQQNESRVAICNAIDKGYGIADIVRNIRLHCYSSPKEPWNGVVSNDVRCENIRNTIKRVIKARKSGKLKTDEVSGKYLRSTSVKSGARGRKVLSPVKAMEEELLQWCTQQWEKKKAVTRGIIFCKSLRILPTHCGGMNEPNLFSKLKSWFYRGFNKRCNLSKRRVSSTGQKLPLDWKDKVASIINRVAGAQMPVQRRDGSFVNGVRDDDLANTDQVPMYVEDHSKAVWGDKSSKERRLIGTAGKDKDRITCQLTCFKSGRKAKPFVILKAARPPIGHKFGNKNTITYHIHHNIPDRWGNHFPTRNKLHITVSPTANSNGELTVEFIQDVLFPECGAVNGELVRATGLLCDAFAGHYAKEVKEHNNNHDLLNWMMMDGGITPKAQPLDVLINKIFKGFFRDIFEEWSLNAPIQPNGHPYAPSRQLLCTWVVAAWEKVPESLVRKAWEVCGYRSIKNLEEESQSDAIVEFDNNELGRIVEKLGGIDANDAWIDDENDPDVGPEEGFPDFIDDGNIWDFASVETD